jgi:endonuclease/exonuclease/phosphatase (EEP) superfamily protein YafD
VRRGSVTLAGLLQAAAILTIIATALASIDTRQHLVELFSHFRLQYLVAALLLLIVFAVRRRALFSLLLVIAVAINTSYVLPWYTGDAPATGSTALKILYANVLSSNRDHDRLLALIEREGPDIIVLQEVSGHWLAALRVLDADYPFSRSAPREDNFGIAIWSRLPLSAAMQIDSPPLGFPSILAVTEVDGAEVTLVTSHPMIPVGGDNFAARNQQLKSIEETVAAVETPVILIGDLNASIWDRYYRRLEDATGLNNARRGNGILPTWPTFMPLAMIPIDHVLVSSQIGVADIRTGSRIGSDHLPLIVTVTL